MKTKKLKQQLSKLFIASFLVSGFVASFISCSKTDSDQMNNSKNQKQEEFIHELLAKMTLDEKIGQTALFTSGYDVITGPTVDPNYKKYLTGGMVGGLFNAVGAKYNRILQQLVVDSTRLGIPLLFGYDVIHGQRSIFPIPLAEACSWDLQAIKRSAQIAAKEASAEGINWVYAPMVDIARDPRWGRVAEGAGEDVYLGSLIAKARVEGFQGSDLSAKNTVAACVKHYAGYGAVLAGRDYNSVDMSLVELWNTYLPPFQAAVDADCASLMTAFNDLNGIPASANKYLLTDILRKKWNFQGMVVTDYTSMNEMVAHGYAKDDKHSAELAMNAGVDMDMQGAAYMFYLKELVKEGKVTEEQITTAAHRVLDLKYRLGLFDDPYRYCDTLREKSDLLNPTHLEATRDMARKSMVLLKNEGQVLPLAPNKKIALIGPLAKDKDQIIGCWSAMGDRETVPVSIYEGLEEAIGAKNILYAKGCNIMDDSTQGFAEAIRVAKRADVVVLCMGEFQNMSGENNSRTNLNLPGVQLELLKEIKKTGKPTVLVLMNGRPLTLNWENKHMDALLETWFPGTMGGAAIADVLTGKYNPSGKLTITFPQNVGQIPLFYNHKNTGRPFDPKIPELAYGSHYWDVSNDPLYPFGYGLSYTSFNYSDLQLSSPILSKDKNIQVSVKVSNTGKYDGEEVVQLYTRQMVGSITRPVKELKGFEKVMIKKGESKTIEFTLSVDDLRFYNSELKKEYEPGDFKVFVGGSSASTLEDHFKLQ